MIVNPSIAPASITKSRSGSPLDLSSQCVKHRTPGVSRGVLGGTSLAGGRFFLLGSILGALVIQTLTTTIYAAGVAPEITLVVKGLVVLVVSILQSDKIKAAVGAVAAGGRRSP